DRRHHPRPQGRRLQAGFRNPPGVQVGRLQEVAAAGDRQKRPAELKWDRAPADPIRQGKILMLNRRHGKHDEGTGVQLNMVITPFLDMSFQLLFFFVLSFKPAEAMEGKLDFHLPATGEARARRMEDVDPSKPSDSDLALPTQVTVLVKTIRDGVN